MKVTIITFCLIGAVFANPISYNVVLESSELDSNSTESLSVSQSSENDTSELQSSEENTSDQSQSSESDSLESTSEDKTSEESDSQSDEDEATDSMAETRDDSMGSEENVRKSWVREFASVVKVLSAEDNSSAEVKGRSDQVTEKQPSAGATFRERTDAARGDTNLPLAESPGDSSDAAGGSSDAAGGVAGVAAAAGDSSESSESDESSEASDSSDSSDASESSESSELGRVRAPGCANGTQSCESEEYFFQGIGDDAHYSVDSLMVPDEDERELSLRR